MTERRETRALLAPARALRAEFGPRRLNRVLAGVALRVAALAGLCLLGAHFLID